MRLHWLFFCVVLFALFLCGPGAAQYDVDVRAPDGGGGWGFPGTNITHTFTVENTGTYTDGYDFVANSSRGWTIVQPQNITLAPGNIDHNVRVIVVIPAGALANMVDTVTLQAVSQGSSETDTAQATTRVHPVAGVSIDAPGSFFGDPGETVTINFSVRNTGNDIDNFTIEAYCEDSQYRVWNLTYDKVIEDLETGDVAVLSVDVTVPRSTWNSVIAADTTATLRVQATSDYDIYVDASSQALIDISESRDVDIRLMSESTVEIDIFETATFLINVTNVANYASTDTFHITNSTAPPNWRINVEDPNVTLGNGDWKIITVTAESRTRPENRRAQITIRAESDSDSTKYRTVDVVALIPQVYGVEVTALEPLVLEGKPMEVLQFSFNIRNQGNDMDSFTIDGSTPRNFLIESPGSLNLDYDENQDIFINVTVTAGTPARTNETLTLNATCGDEKTGASATATIIVLQGFSVTIEPEENGTTAIPGETVNMELVVTNTGNGRDSFELRTINDVSGPGISLLPGNTTPDLLAGISTIVTLRVVVPGDALSNDGYTIVIEANSTEDPAEGDSAICTISLTQVAGVEIAPPETARGPPNGDTVLNFTFNNTGNGIDSYNYDIVSTSNWRTDPINPAALDLVEPGETRILQVQVYIPSGLVADTSDTVILNLTSKHDGKVSDSEWGKVIVDLVTGVDLQTRDLDIFGGSDVWKVIPNEELTVPVYVINTGNGRENVSLDVSQTGDWTVWLDRPLVLLDFEESTTVYVTIRPPSNSLNDPPNYIDVDGTVVEGPGQDDVRIEVETSFVMPYGPPFVYIFPDSEIEYGIMVRNEFPEQRTFTLYSNTTYPGWDVELDSSSFILTPGQSRIMYVTIHSAPSIPHFHELDFTVNVQVSGLAGTEDLNFLMITLSPDISISDVTFEDAAWEGDELTVTFTVRSHGRETGDPMLDTLFDLPIEVYYDGKLIHRETIDLPMDGERTLAVDIKIPELDWFNRTEKHTLTIKAAAEAYEGSDPGRRRNNVVSTEITVSKRPSPFALLALPIILLGAFAALRANSKRVSIRQRRNEHLIKGLIVASAISLFILLPVESEAIDAAALPLAYIMLVMIIPLYTMITGYRTKSYLSTVAICAMMFGIFFVSLSSGRELGSMLDGLFVTPDLLPFPGFVYPLIALILGLIAVYIIVSMLESAKGAYMHAKAFIESVKEGES